MDLDTLNEVFCDWWAAVQTNGPEDDIFKSIEIHKDTLGPVVAALFTNQAKKWKLEDERSKQTR